CAAPSAKGDDKFITTDYLQQCLSIYAHSRLSFCHPILLHRFCCIDTVTGFVTAGERFIV
nr:hypothetical protein [Escherichia coli]